MRGRDWEHLDVPHLGFASCPSGRGEHTVLVVFSAADPASSRDIPAAYRANLGAEAMVMTPDTRASRRTRDPETDPRLFFESSSKRGERDVPPPRSRCSLLLVPFYSFPLLSLFSFVRPLRSLLVARSTTTRSCGSRTLYNRDGRDVLLLLLLLLLRSARESVGV